MNSKPHMRRYPNYGYNPYETRVDLRTRCTVCGWAGIDPIATQEPEAASFSTVITGTTYVIPAGTAADGLSVLDKSVLTQLGAFSGCPFCGAANWSWAREPDLHW